MKYKNTKRALISLAICLLILFSQFYVVPYAMTSGKQDEVTIALSKDSYPFHFLDEKGQPAGILVEFWKKWSEKTGTKIKFVSSDFATTIENVKNGVVDLHAGCFYSDERNAFFEFGFPVIEVETSIFYEGSIKKISALKEMKAYRIGVIKGDYAEGYLRKNIPDSSLVTFGSYNSMLRAADNGDIKVFVADKLTALYEMNKSNLAPTFKYNSDYPIYTNYIYAASKKGNKELINQVNLGMSALTQKERNDIISKWTQDFGNRSLVRIAVSTDYPPFSYADKNGNPQGLIVDLWNLWGQKTNREVQFILQDWDNSVLSIRNGTADIHSGLFENAERDKYMTFSHNIYPIESRLFYNPKYSSLEPSMDLNYKKIGVLKGSFQETYMKDKFPLAEIIPFSKTSVMLEAIDNGLLAGFMHESMNIRGMYAIKEVPYPLVDVPGSEFSVDMKAGVSKLRPELMAVVNRGLDEITNAEWIALETKWITDPRDRLHSKVVPLDLTAEEKEWIREHPSLLVGSISESKPYNDSNAGTYTGISADFMNYILNQIGIKPIVTFNTWENLLNSVGSPQGAEVFFSIVKTEAQAKQLLFTEPYLKVPQVLVTRAGTDTISSLSGLSNLKVAVEKGFYKIEYLMKNPKIELVYFDSTLNALLAVSSGQADAYIGDLYSTRYYIESSTIRNLKTSTYSDLPSFELSIAVNKQLSPLKSIIQKALNGMPEITKKAILSKYSVSQDNTAMILSDSEAAWISAHNSMRLTVQDDWKPISFFNSAKAPTGLAYAIWERCQRTLNIQTILQSAPYYLSAMETIMNGSSDVLIATVKSPEKMKYMNFTNPYLKSPLILMTHDRSGTVSDLDAIDKERVGIISGSFAEDILKTDYPKLTYIAYNSSGEAYKALSNRKIDVLADSLFSADYSIKSFGFENIRVSGITGYTYEICIGVRKDWPELVNILNRVIDTTSSSERVAIEETWVSQAIPEQIDWTKPLIAVGMIMGILLAIILITVYWNRKMQKEIIERKIIETELVSAKEIADIASVSKTEFLANMSHEIRTPMNAIIGMINLMNNTDLTQRQHDYLSKISHAAYSLLSVINDILDFSKIEAGKLTLETVEFSLDAVLDHVSDIVNIKARDKDLELLLRRESDIPDRLVGDALRIEQILINLANNAVKFTAAGEVEIAVRATSKSEAEVTLEFMIRDTGIGIDDSRLEELFMPFTQSDTSITRKFGGTGLGLSICRRLAELMHGRVWATSIPDTGCNFYFEVKLPFEDAHKLDYSSLGHGMDNKRILVVDDNRTALEILKVQLNGFKITADTVLSGEEALERIKSTSYDMILMDWRMPGIDGYETARQIRNLENIPQPHIVIVTAYGQDKKLYNSKLHLDGVLHKPVSESALFNTIQSVMQGVEHSPKEFHQNRINPAFLAGFRVLSVEDNLLNQQIIFELLELAGAKVHQVSNGVEALDWLDKSVEVPDVILMDLQMPQLDGYETTRRLRKDSRFEKIPVFAMTADVMSGVYDKCLQAGMDDYISKPLNLEELYGKLGQFLNIEKAAFIMEIFDEIAQPYGVGADVKLLNIERALRQLGNNKKLLMNILQRFQNDYGNIDVQIDSHLESEDIETATRFFHTLKSTAGSIGSAHIHSDAEEIEKMLSVRGEESLEPIVTKLKGDVKAIMKEIAMVLENYVTEVAVQAEKIEFKDLMGQLREPLQNRKPADIENILSRVNFADFSEEEKEILEEIRNFCSKYRYKDALDVVGKWM